MIKSNYSFKKWDEEFKYKKYLSHNLSENSRRVPKIPSVGFPLSFESTKSPLSRPDTSGSVMIRPSTSIGFRSKQNYLDL